jgi:hypothetical protein
MVLTLSTGIDVARNAGSGRGTQRWLAGENPFKATSKLSSFQPDLLLLFELPVISDQGK